MQHAPPAARWSSGRSVPRVALDSATMPDVLSAIARAAFANGATHVSLNIAKLPAA